MRLPTQILLLGAILTNGARATEPVPAAPAETPKPAGEPVVQLEPVRVTADLWETPLDRIPASVSVYDGAELRAEGVRHFGDIADQIPNLTWTGATSRPRYFQIRGIGENSQYEGETPDSSVRFLADDLDLTGLGTVGATFDLRQVEVLRGPQAGAFGANAAGGVIRLVTNDPTPYWTGDVEGTVGSDNLRSAGVAAGGPVIAARPEELMIRVAVQQSASDGFRKNATLGGSATNERDESMARIKAIWNPNAVWRWDGALFFADANNGFDEFALDNNGRVTFSDRPGRDEQKTFGGSVRGAYSGWQDARFTTTTNASNTDSLYSYDADWTAASYAGFSALRRHRTVAGQELRLDSELEHDALGFVDQWTLGAYFSGTDEDGDYRYADAFGGGRLLTDYQARNEALFGQAAHDFSDRTRVTLGLRVEQVNVRGVGDSTFAPARRFSSDFDDTLFGGKIALEQKLGERHLAFASVTRGYKAGGANLDGRINPASDPLTYETEQLWNYEAGLRGNWFEQRLTGELTAFYLDRYNTQVRDAAGFGGSYRFFTDNGGRANVHGLESSAIYALTERWSVNASLALMESDLERFTLANGNPAGGRQLANTPHYGYTVGVRYKAPRGVFGNLELVGRGEQLDSNDQNEARGAFDVLNGAIGYAWERWSVTVWGRNLCDTAYEKRVFFFGNADPAYIPTCYEDRADPRQIGVSAAYKF